MLVVINASHRQDFSANMNKKQLFITVGTTSTFLRLIQIWKMMTASNPARSQKLFIKVKKHKILPLELHLFLEFFSSNQKYCTFLSKLKWTGNRIRTLEPLVFEALNLTYHAPLLFISEIHTADLCDRPVSTGTPKVDKKCWKLPKLLPSLVVCLSNTVPAISQQPTVKVIY